MLYLDSSLVVAAATIEAETARVQQWLRDRADQTIAISDWVETEFSAALSIKLRRRQLALAERDASLRLLAEEIGAAFERLPVAREDFRAASQFADQYELGLRGGDALHLAIAARNGLTLCTLDEGQAEAGPALGIRTVLV